MSLKKLKQINSYLIIYDPTPELLVMKPYNWLQKTTGFSIK